MNQKIDYSQKYQSILVMVLGFSLLSLLFDVPYLLYGALGIGVISLLSSSIADWIVFLWFKLAHVMGWVMSKVLLSLIFYVFLFPISMLYRLFSDDTLMLKKGLKTTFKERNHLYTKKDLENIW